MEGQSRHHLEFEHRVRASYTSDTIVVPVLNRVCGDSEGKYVSWVSRGFSSCSWTYVRRNDAVCRVLYIWGPADWIMFRWAFLWDAEHKWMCPRVRLQAEHHTMLRSQISRICTTGVQTGYGLVTCRSPTTGQRNSNRQRSIQEVETLNQDVALMRQLLEFPSAMCTYSGQRRK